MVSQPCPRVKSWGLASGVKSYDESSAFFKPFPPGLPAFHWSTEKFISNTSPLALERRAARSPLLSTGLSGGDRTRSNYGWENTQGLGGGLPSTGCGEASACTCLPLLCPCYQWRVGSLMGDTKRKYGTQFSLHAGSIGPSARHCYYRPGAD